VELESECAHCGKALHITIGSDLNCHVREKEAQPLLFEPEIDWETFRGANIIDDY
jgi:hypothetical protein